MAIHIGLLRGGFAGLVLAGVCFIVPAALISAVFGALYVAYGNLPEVEPWVFGIQPTVLAVIVAAVWKLGRKAVRGWDLVAIGCGVAVVPGFAFGDSVRNCVRIGYLCDENQLMDAANRIKKSIAA